MENNFPLRNSPVKLLVALLIFFFISVPIFSQEIADSIKVKNWNISALVLTVIIPDNTFVLPIVYATYKRWHFEPRYNYENMETFSMFAGYDFSGGKKFKYLFTPMLGGVVGRTNGVAPGLEFDLAWGRVGLYSETEYVLDMNYSAESYLYVWSQLRFAATKWMILGLVGSRNRVYQNNVNIQRGVSLSFIKGKNALTGYYYNAFTSDQYWSFSFLRRF